MWVEQCTVCSYEGGGTVSFVVPNSCDPDADKEVTGYFQLSDLAQFAKLRELLPELQSAPGVQIIQRLRSDGLGWHIAVIKRGRARRYQKEA